jgi:uncharacterized repeat protein (TIGR01451 family)
MAPGFSKSVRALALATVILSTAGGGPAAAAPATRSTQRTANTVLLDGLSNDPSACYSYVVQNLDSVDIRTHHVFSAAGSAPVTYDFPITASDRITVSLLDLQAPQPGWAGSVEVTSTNNIAGHVICPATGVQISGPKQGEPGVLYDFVATVDPITVTTPLTYVWGVNGQTLTRSGGVSDTFSIGWDVTGTHDITVAVLSDVGPPVLAGARIAIAGIPIVLPPPVFNPAPCGPMDVVFVLDDTGSMGGALNNVKAAGPSIISQISAASGGNYQLGLITLKQPPFGNDYIYVHSILAPGANPVSNTIQTLTAGGGAGWAEISDEALNTAINLLPAGTRPQNINFSSPWRPVAKKIIILVTDAPPAGLDDWFVPGVDDAAAALRANQALTAGIKISAIYVPTWYDATTAAIMQNYAATSGGYYMQTAPDGSGTASAIASIIKQCGSGPGGLSVVKASSTTSMTIGGTAIFTITVTNNSPTTTYIYQGPRDVLTPSLALISATPGYTYTPPTVRWNVTPVALAPLHSDVYTIEVRARECCTFVNVAQVGIPNGTITPTVLSSNPVTVTVGPCCVPGTRTFSAGVNDDFKPGNAEPNTVRPEVVQWILHGNAGLAVGFDATKNDRVFIHSFTNLTGTLAGQYICTATLEIKMKPMNVSLTQNDTLVLQFVTPSGPVPGAGWGRQIGTYGTITGLLPNAWQPSNYPAGHTFLLDLAALPAFSGTTPITRNLLPYLNSLGLLDVILQDDTAVDYAILRVGYCCKSDTQTGKPDLSIVKRHTSDWFIDATGMPGGSQGYYLLSVTNNGTAPATGPITVTDIIPPGLVFVSANGSGWTCANVGAVVTCVHPGPLAPGASLPPISIVVQRAWPPVATVVRNCARVQGANDPNGANNTDCDVADLPRPTGGITGTVTLSTGVPLSGTAITVFRFVTGAWTAGRTVTTNLSGLYFVGGLEDDNYRLLASHPTRGNRYYANAANITTTPDVAVVGGGITPNINFVYPVTKTPPAGTGEIVSTTNGGMGSVTVDPTTGQLSVVITRTGAVKIRTQVSCANGTTPTNVVLIINTTPPTVIPMTEVPPGSGNYEAVISAMLLLLNQSYQMTVEWDCGPTHEVKPIGTIELHDPSGNITDIVTGKPVSGALVTLYKVPGWSAAQDVIELFSNANTCESNLTRDVGAAWAQPAPEDEGVFAAPGSGEISPAINPQTAGANGRYAWDVAAGCWYVTVSAPGYFPQTSPVVGVPPAVTDLDIQLTPIIRPMAFLPIVSR